MRKSVARAMTLVLFFALFSVFAHAQDTIKIGVILPLTGPNAVIGQEEKRGIDMAIEKINAAGGALKKKVELIVEDNKGDPTVIVSAAEKLITRDKVAALTGGYSSVESLALLAAMKKYEPVTVWQGGGAVKMDQMYGKERWFFMLHPRSPDYQRNITDFLANIQPVPKRIAIAYEDTSYGVDHSKVAKQYLTEKGFELVTFEPFKSGTLDFSPSSPKSGEPSRRDLLLDRLRRGFDPPHQAGQGTGFLPQDAARHGRRGLPRVPGFPEEGFRVRLRDRVLGPLHPFPRFRPVSPILPQDGRLGRRVPETVQPGTQLLVHHFLCLPITLTNAINKAGTTEKEKLIAALEATDTMTPMGHMKFFKNQFGAIHQSFPRYGRVPMAEGPKGDPLAQERSRRNPWYPLPSWEKR